ncbi:MAG TPA: aminotransferase class IV [Aggregatilinea sp.]|uniref:aminotransferase class IV n=1 Tax=Aggregatilinea sp. TaxID=2806333 RepID=UPI002C687820|nr:aminotransferase class IV [Aggregatilinea sp.]HML20851.1 aminotransferase class IV [Aggregatilinea sp.]
MQHTESIPVSILGPEGLSPAPYRAASLAEAVVYEPNGVYTVARTFFRTRALLFDAHLDRLEESARLAGILLDLDRARLRAALREMIEVAGYADTKFRITVPEADPAHLYLSIEALQPVDPVLLANGVNVALVPIRRATPQIKTTVWMEQRRGTASALPGGAYEGVMQDDRGCVLEGLSSNFYGVLAGVLRTAGDGVLAGITRKAIFEIAPDVLPVDLTPICREDIGRLDEAMLTSSGRGVVPVTAIDGKPVGSGRVGPVVQALMAGYGQWTEAHAEPI